MFLVDMRISSASPSIQHSEITACAIGGQPAQFGSDGPQPSANRPVGSRPVFCARRQVPTEIEPTGPAAHNLCIVRTVLFGTRPFRWINSDCQCVPLWRGSPPLEADHSLRPALPLQRGPRWRGSCESIGISVKVDACDAACSMDHENLWPPKPIVKVPIQLYNRSTWRLRLGSTDKSRRGRYPLVRKSSPRLPVLPSAK